MDTVGDKQAGTRPGSQAGSPRAGQGARAGQSGEGSRSVMEQLIQQEKKRDAQLPREGSGAAETAPAP